MKIDIIIDRASWLNEHLYKFIETLKGFQHEVRCYYDVKALETGDILFVLSCGQLLNQHNMKLHKHNLIVHESLLPEGKGWSPLTWQILEGKNSIPITLFECAESVDSGDIYLQDEMVFEGHELVDELRVIQANKTFELCLEFLKQYPQVVSKKQRQCGKSTYYKKRTPADSKIDINLSIADQFNLLRIVDNDKYPAFFEYGGKKYLLRIEKYNEKL